MFVRFKRPPITARFEKHCSTCRKDYPPPMNRRHCKTCKAVLKLICPCGKQLSIQGGHVYMHLQGCRAAQAVLNPRGTAADSYSKEDLEADESGDEREEAAMLLSTSVSQRPAASSVGQHEAAAPPPALNFSSFMLPPLSSLSFTPQQCASSLLDLRPHGGPIPSRPAGAGQQPQIPVAIAMPSPSVAFPMLRPPGAPSSRSAFVPPRLPPPPSDLV